MKAAEQSTSFTFASSSLRPKASSKGFFIDTIQLQGHKLQSSPSLHLFLLCSSSLQDQSFLAMLTPTRSVVKHLSMCLQSLTSVDMKPLNKMLLLSRLLKVLLLSNIMFLSLVLLHLMHQKICLLQPKPSNDWLADSIGLMMNATMLLRVASLTQLQANGRTSHKQLQWEPLSMTILRSSSLSASQIQVPASFCKLMSQECA